MTVQSLWSPPLVIISGVSFLIMDSKKFLSPIIMGGVVLILHVGAPRTVFSLTEAVEPFDHPGIPFNDRHPIRCPLCHLIFLLFILPTSACTLGPRRTGTSETGNGHNVRGGSGQHLQLCWVQTTQVEEALQVRPGPGKPVAHV